MGILDLLSFTESYYSTLMLWKSVPTKVFHLQRNSRNGLFDKYKYDNFKVIKLNWQEQTLPLNLLGKDYTISSSPPRWQSNFWDLRLGYTVHS